MASRCIFILCLLAFPVFQTFSASDPLPFWTPQPTRVSLGTAFSSEVSACSFEDNIYVVWSDDRTGNKEIFFRTSRDGGHTWGREEKLTDTPGESSQPAIACDSRNVYVAWQERTASFWQIRIKLWDGNVWNEKVLIEGDEELRRPRMASTSAFPSQLYIVWERIENGSSNTGGSQEDSKGKKAFICLSTDGGQSFSAPQPLVEGTWSTKEPAVWCGARDAYVVWVDNREGGWNIFFRRWGSAQLEAKLSQIPDCGSPSIGGAEPNIYIAWQSVESNAFYADIFLSYSTDYGTTWHKAERLTQGEAESVFPKVATLVHPAGKTGHEPWVFWQDGRNGEWQVWALDAEYWAQIAEGQAPEIAPLTQPLTSVDKPSVLADVTSTIGQLHLFWSQIESNSQANIMYMRRDTLPPKRPGTPYHFDLSASAGYDDDDRITFLWEAGESKGIEKYNVYVSVDDGDWVLAGESYHTYYDLPGESGKVYQVYVQAIDEVGNVSEVGELSPKIICDPDPPEVIIHSPRSNSTIRGKTPIIISVHDSNLLEFKVEYGQTSLPSAWDLLSGPFSEETDRLYIVWDTSHLSGIYTLRVSAKDRAGNESRAQSLVNIDARPPSQILPDEVAQLTPTNYGWTYASPAWSPDGNKIAFHSDEGGSEDIWLMSANGGDRVRLTRSTAIEHNPEWSPSGDMIVFQSLTPVPPQSWDIWVMRANGQDPKKLISNGENPSWSPDGSSIAFDSTLDGDSDIYLITDVSGAEPKLVKLTFNDWDDKNPRWSPDGSRIVFQSNGKGSWDILEMRIDGADIAPIIATPADEIEPDWSPDGKWVLFSTNEAGDSWEVRAVTWPQADEEVRLSPAGKDARKARWSPKMDSIVFEQGGSLCLTPLVSPEEDLEAVISWPRGGEVLTGKIDIKGIACGRNFQKYSLQFSKPKEGSFQLIGGESTSQVPKTGFLGRWDTSELEGEYLLKLTVTGRDGSSLEDSVSVLISNRLPFIRVVEPQDGLVTGKPLITVKGYTEARSFVTLNDNEVRVNPDGSFSCDLQLKEGPNNITIRARSPSTQGKEHVIERMVILDTEPPKITIESPKDFQVVNVPYVAIKGRVSEEAEVSILGKRVWTAEDGSFERIISINEGMNSLLISASDRLGHYEQTLLRVIFKKAEEVKLDSQAPGITDVFPDSRTVFTGRDLQVSAKLVDDVGIDPFSIKFFFDNKEVTGEGSELAQRLTLDIEMPDPAETIPQNQYPVINLSFRPGPISDGAHNFKISVKDTSGNLTEFVSNFFADTTPPQAIVSAFLNETGNRIRLVAVMDKPILRINSAEAIQGDGGGYSISSLIKKDGYYESFLDISPSQKSFFIRISATTYLGGEIDATGYIAWNTVRSGEKINLGAKDGPQFLSDPIGDIAGKLTLVLRSQDGLDSDTLTMQKSDAEYRKLQPVGLAYVLSVSKEQLEVQGTLSLPPAQEDYGMPVMFWWDEELRQWHPLDTKKLSGSHMFSARITGPGTYTLFSDIEPPVIRDISPADTGEVPLDRFFISANIFDRGSGISQIRFAVDGKQRSYDYDPVSGQFIYFPSELEWGLHRMEIVAIDRAGNSAEFSTNFVTREAFLFIKVRAYPNPAQDEVKIEFKLTRPADVKLRIYTFLGELVYTSERENIAEGKFVWDRKNSAGRRVASGIYIYSLEATVHRIKTRKQGSIAII